MDISSMVLVDLPTKLGHKNGVSMWVNISYMDDLGNGYFQLGKSLNYWLTRGNLVIPSPPIEGIMRVRKWSMTTIQQGPMFLMPSSRVEGTTILAQSI